MGDVVGSTGGLAAWVQAAGSLLALGIAIYIPTRAATTRSRAFAISAQRLIFDSMWVAMDFEHNCTRGEGREDETSRDAIDRAPLLVAQLETYPVHELPPKAVLVFQAFRREFGALVDLMEPVRAAPKPLIIETKVDVRIRYTRIVRFGVKLLRRLGTSFERLTRLDAKDQKFVDKVRADLEKERPPMIIIDVPDPEPRTGVW